MTKLEDEDNVIAQAKRGNRAAYAKLFEHYNRYIYNFALGKVGIIQDAEDATQDTFKRAWQSIQTFEQASSFPTWIIGIAKNVIREHGRATSPVDSLIDIEEHEEKYDRVADGISVPGFEDNVMNKIEVENILKSVSEEDRVLLVYHSQGYDYVTIAQVLGLQLTRNEYDRLKNRYSQLLKRLAERNKKWK